MELLEDEYADVPLSFTAAICKVYDVPAAKDPVTVTGLDNPVVVVVIEGFVVVTYEVILFPPVAGAVNVKETVVLFVLVRVPMVGA